MDPGLSRAVREVFVRLYHEGLIYRSEYLVSWCPRCTTVLSDLESPHKPVNGKLYRIRYELVDGSGAIEVETTRPETLLGDTAVAVHPDDERWSGFVGKHVRLPLLGREIPVVADAFVDREFGTGAVKVTPAHDPNDFECGRRLGLPAINILHPDGRLNDNAGPYADLDIAEARKQVVADLEAQGLLAGVTRPPARGAALRPLRHAGAAAALRAVVHAHGAARRARHRRGARGPRRAASEELGEHLLPLDGEHPRLGDLAAALVGPPHPGLELRDVQRVDRRARGSRRTAPTAAAPRSRQESDVLDTWFSSALWPFSTMGWPDDTTDAAPLLPDRRALDGARHHLLLGRPHDHDGPPLHRRPALPRRLPPSARARRAGPQVLQVEGHRHRPDWT